VRRSQDVVSVLCISHPNSSLSPARASLGGGVMSCVRGPCNSNLLTEQPKSQAILNQTPLHQQHTLALRGDIPRPSSFLVVAGIRQGLRGVHPVQLHPVRRQHCTLHATALPTFPVCIDPPRLHDCSCQVLVLQYVCTNRHRRSRPLSKAENIRKRHTHSPRSETIRPAEGCAITLSALHGPAAVCGSSLFFTTVELLKR
jgi:hypothetical protein